MSRPGVLIRHHAPPTCAACGREIIHDVVRVDEGRVFHVRCFIDDASEARKLFECPKCHAVGATWNRRRQDWRVCTICKGSGYLADRG